MLRLKNKHVLLLRKDNVFSYWGEEVYMYLLETIKGVKFVVGSLKGLGHAILGNFV